MNNKVPNIYVINKGCHDYSAAEKFGRIIFLTDGLYNQFATGQIYREFRESLKDSNPDDLILISGLTVMASIACSMFGAIHGRLNLLIFSKGKGRPDRYVKRTIMMRGVKDEKFSKEAQSA